MVTFYGYDKCSTCRKAEKLLQARKVPYKKIDITTTPPPKALLQQILKVGSYTLSELFNKSGQLYRELNMKDKMKTLPEKELLDLLASNGKLVKRPVVTDGASHTVGFDETIFKRTWK